MLSSIWSFEANVAYAPMRDVLGVCDWRGLREV